MQYGRTGQLMPSLGIQDGAVWQYSGSFDNFMKNLHAGNVTRGGHGLGVKPSENVTAIVIKSAFDKRANSSQSDTSSYWLSELAQYGSVSWIHIVDICIFANKTCSNPWPARIISSFAM